MGGKLMWYIRVCAVCGHSRFVYPGPRKLYGCHKCKSVCDTSRLEPHARAGDYWGTKNKR